MYELWYVIIGYDNNETPVGDFCVTWYDEESGCDFAQDRPDSDPYPSSNWIGSAEYCGEYDTREEAWGAVDNVDEEELLAAYY